MLTLADSLTLSGADLLWSGICKSSVDEEDTMMHALWPYQDVAKERRIDSDTQCTKHGEDEAHNRGFAQRLAGIASRTETTRLGGNGLELHLPIEAGQ